MGKKIRVGDPIVFLVNQEHPIIPVTRAKKTSPSMPARAGETRIPTQVEKILDSC